jgi:hypothetical protein
MRDFITQIEAENFQGEASGLNNFLPWVKLKEAIALLSLQFDIERAADVVVDRIMREEEALTSDKLPAAIRPIVLEHLAHAVKIAQHGQAPMLQMIKILRRTCTVLMDPRTIATWHNEQFLIANPDLPPCELNSDYMMREVPMIIMPFAMQKISGSNTEAVKADFKSRPIVKE